MRKLRIAQATVSVEWLQENITHSDLIIFDARPAPRFNGEVEEPRAGLRKGHMPNAKPCRSQI